MQRPGSTHYKKKGLVKTGPFFIETHLSKSVYNLLTPSPAPRDLHQGGENKKGESRHSRQLKLGDD